MKVSLLVAVAENGVIGRGGQLPWRLSADLKRFKQLTLGHHLIMGRKTFESIGRVLPGRTSIVISRQSEFTLPVSVGNALGGVSEGCRLAHSLDEALRIADYAGDTEAFIIGGAEIFALALPLAERLYLTAVHAEVPGDTFFTLPPLADWTLLQDERHPADAKNEFEYSFRVWERSVY